MLSLKRTLAITGAVVALAAFAPLASASALGEIHLQKICPTFETTATCTVVVSDAGPIPVGTVAAYSGPLFSPVFSTAVVLTTPGGSTATGHCTLVWRPELSGDDGFGTCVFVSGTGALAGFHANLKITDHPDTLVTNWDGTYGFRN